MVRLALTAEQICRLVKGSTTLDQSFCIDNIASLEAAGPTDMAVVLGRGEVAVFTQVPLATIAASKAAVILADRQLVPDKHYIIVADPLHAYTQILQFTQQHASTVEEQIASSAVIAPDVILGDGVHIGPHAVIGAGVQIGSYARIGAHVVIEAGAQIGDSADIRPRAVIGTQCVVGAHSIMHAGVVVGSDGFGYQVTSKGMRKIPQIGTVKIGNHVEIGAGCCIDRGTFDATVIGDGVKIDNLVHIAHNVQIGAGTAILAHTGIAGGAIIGAGCQIGGQVAIKDHITISDRARIVSKSGVIKDVPAGATVAGQPAVDFRLWKRTLAALNSLVAARVKPSQADWRTALWQRVATWLPKGRR